MKKLGFKKSRLLSDICYILGGTFLLFRVAFITGYEQWSWPSLVAAAVFFCLGLYIYSKGCRCPSCGKSQPRYCRKECHYCHAQLK